MGWFVVLPDHASAAPVGAALRARSVQEISHSSGRPWLLGHWDGAPPAVGAAGATRIAVLGDHALTRDRLTAAAARIRTLADLDHWAARLPGSFHLVASVDGRIRVQGNVTGFRPVFHARAHDTHLAGDRADVLAALTGAAIDERRLAPRLLNSSALHPVTARPVWRGVDSVPGGHCLVIDARGHGRTVRHWTPPEPVLPMAEGAAALREALRDAVAARVGGRELVSCDLGGLDSTSVCCLAAAGPARVVAYTADTRDPMGSDADWARRTVAALGGVEHHVIAGDDVPLVYDGLADADDLFDEPCPAVVHRTGWLVVPRAAADRGSHLHLTGFGGDELLAGSPAHLHTLLRRHPGVAWQRVRGFAAQRPWSYREAVRQLRDTSTYGAWLARVADGLTAPPPAENTPTLDWGMPPRMPPWATPDAVAAVREAVRDAAATARPLAATRGQHVELEAMRCTSRMVRQLAQMAGRFGLDLAAPYYDDRVIEAGMAVRAQDRVTPWAYKPLITEAMRGVVPEESLARHTKDEGSYDVETGLRDHRAGLLALCEDSRLARLGLIDAHALRAVCERPLPPSLQFDALYQTVACEVWLRTLETAAVPS
ncbi:lasso peptide isopeptide bond-forming cyclase [Streptomyces capillispiralis]|uniref:lasso peptide isopeptide bond-forming cyclase n=1 Tax=Streptomyces capillispiralis TaxID=68182 RepID=UPI0036907D6F